jgi:phosphonate transport system substrate-binding protein
LGKGAALWGVLAALALTFVTPPVSPASPEKENNLHTLGVVGFYNPRLMYLKYQPLVDYLADATGWPWELQVSLDYEQTAQSLCSGKLDLAYLGPFTYVRAHESCGAIPVVRLATRGLADYRSVILVRDESRYQGLADLRGAMFAFGSPLSTSSHMIPRLMLIEAGLVPGRDIVCRYYGHHDQAARAVLLGEADACGVRDIVGDRFVGRGLRVLESSRAIPNFPLVVAPTLQASERRKLVSVLVERPEQDPAVRGLMESWDEEIAGGFAPVSDADYDIVRQLARKVFGPNALTMPVKQLLCGARE